MQSCFLSSFHYSFKAINAILPRSQRGLMMANLNGFYKAFHFIDVILIPAIRGSQDLSMMTIYIPHEDISLYKVYVDRAILAFNPEISTLGRREIICLKEDLILYILEFDYNKRLCGITSMFVYWCITSIDIIDLTQQIYGKVYFMAKPITNNTISKIWRFFGFLSYRKHCSLKWANLGD